MIDGKKVTAIILSAGNSMRFGKDRNKNFELINNKSVLSYSVNEFDKNKYVDNIIIAVKECEIEDVKKILKKDKYNKDLEIKFGGKTRKESVYNCIKSINTDFVIIHDGARPAIKQKYINECIESMCEFKRCYHWSKNKRYN